MSHAKKILFIGAYTVTVTFNTLYFEVMVQLKNFTCYVTEINYNL